MTQCFGKSSPGWVRNGLEDGTGIKGAHAEGNPLQAVEALDASASTLGTKAVGGACEQGAAVVVLPGTLCGLFV